MGTKKQPPFELDDDIESTQGLAARRLLVEAEAKSRKAKQDEREQHSQGALAEPGLRLDEDQAALADPTATNASDLGQSGPMTTDASMPVDVNASNPATAGSSLGATAVGLMPQDGASPVPMQADDVSSSMSEGAVSAVFGTVSLSSAVTGAAMPATGSMAVTTDQADYAPGSTATFTVAGIDPGSSVAFQIADLPSNPGINGVADVYAPFSVTDGGNGDADGLANGAVVAQWQVPADGSATGAVLQLTAASDGQTATTTFSDAPNKIVTENQKAGTPESVWAIHGSMDNEGDSQIEGFATQMSTNAGQTVSFKIDTASSGYTLDIYRLGYYGGGGAHLVTSMHHSGAANQPTPIFRNSTNTVDAGNWSVTDSWAIPSTAVSGVYFAKLTTDSGNFQNMIPFIVRNDGTTSDMLFQTSDETWEAYNPWGGYNLYQGPSGSNGDRAYAVSYNRPIAMNSTANLAGPQDFLFGEEFAAIYWLEQNGYDVSYISGIDAATNPALLLNTKSYVDVGHDEYWSQPQFANVKAAADAGVDLAFLSGNQIYWDVELAPSLDASATPNRTIVEYKDIWSGAQLDPNGTSNGGAGLFRDPVYGPGTPENSLSGTIFTVDDFGSLDNISIPASMSQLRFWANTSIARGNGGTLTNLLGYEWDSDLDNGFRPAGLIDLSSTTRNVNTLLLDNGATTGSGTATHSLTLYRDPTSGALVFGAGTVMWSWGLSNQYVPYKGLTAPVSAAVQQSMVNLFADMGVTPQTLQASLILAQASTDHTAPTAAITSPTSGSSIGQGQTVTITGTATDVGGRVAGIEVSTDSGATWHPATGTTNWSYTWTASGPGTHVIEARATDDSVNLSSPATLSVTVTGTSLPSLFTASQTPAQTNLNDGLPIEVGVKFQSSVAGLITALKFYRSPGDTGADLLDLWTVGGTNLASVPFTNTSASGWQTVNLSTPVSIAANTTYVASYHTDGAYVATENFFTTAYTSGVLTAPSTTTAGGNGVYAYGGSSTLGIVPTNTFGAANYWADVVFTSSASNTAPTAVADMANATEKGGVGNSTGGSPATGNVLANDTDPDAGDTKTVTAVSVGAVSGTLGTPLVGAHGSLVLNASGDFTYTVNETDPAVQTLRQSTDTVTDAFSYTMRDTAGATSSTTLTITIHGADDAPTLAAQTAGQNAIVGSAFSLVLPAGTFTDVDTGDSLAYTATAADGSPLPAWLSFNAATRAFSGTPAAGNVGALAVKVTATDLGGLAASETFNIAVTTTADTVPTAVADTADATEKGGIANGSGGSPATGNVLTNDTDPDAGDTKTVTAVSFGAVSGTLGTALAGAHGSLVLNAAGDFTYTVNETDAAVQALRQSTDTLTDAFSYTMRDTAGATSSTTLTVTIHGADDAPTLAAQTAGQNATVGSAFSLVLPAGTFTDVDTGDSLTYTATAADGSPLPAWLSFNAATRTFSGTPASGNAGTLGVKVTATDLGGLAASETFNIVVTTPPVTVSLFTASNTPAQTGLNDGSALEVGVKFQSSAAGLITALKFYRSPNDTGADLLDLWTVGGTNLASVAFTNTAASGWQTVNLSSPVSITANTTYIASYHTNGFYVATDDFFNTAVTSGVLTAPSTTTVTGGNGVYSYGGSSTTGIFPTSTFSAANYWADVVFANSASNTPPTAVADTADATEKDGFANGSGGSPATGNVLANDTDPDAGDTKTVTAVSVGAVSGTLGTPLAGAHGSLVLNASGDFTYTVNETDPAVQTLRQSTDTVTDAFSYTMRDTAGATSSTTLTITIHGADDAPTLAAQTGSQNAAVGSAFSLVLPAGTFTDVDTGDSLAYTATAADGSPLPAWLSFNAATRTFSGTPAAGDVGTLGVKVTATDLGGLAASETFSIVVGTAPNTAPTAVADTADATEKGGVGNGTGGSPATGNVLTNDTDPDAGDTKTVTAVSFGAVSGTLGAALAGAHGSLVLNASGAFTYTINETDAAVQALRQSTDTLTDAFSYTMRDTAGATSSTTLTVTIHGADDAPTLAAQTAGQNAVVGSTFSLVLPTGTFTDVDTGDSLAYTATAADGSSLPAWLSFNAATGTFSGTPTSGDVGTLTVKVTATDLGGLAASETFSIVVTTTADTVPTAVADTADATEKGGVGNSTGGSPATGNVLANDTDPDVGDTKTVTAVGFGAVSGTLGTALAGAHGSLVLNAAGDFTYTINETDAAVQALRLSTDTLTDVFSYTMRDTAGATSSTTLTITIHGADDAPTLAAQTAGQNAAVGSAFSLALPAGTFTDVDTGDSLAYTATAADGSPLPAWLSFNAATGTFSGTPAAGDVGTLAVKVTATDLGGLAASETFNIVVGTAPNTAPTAVADTADATEKGGIANGSGGSPATGNVLTNDTDPDAGDTKTVTAVSFGAVSGTLGTALAGAHGSLVLNASGAFTYTINETDAAVQALRLSTDTLTDVFSYTMRDTAGATSSTTLTVTLHGADDAPTVSNLAVGATSISFVANDPDNATLSLASPFAAAFGNPSITTGATTSLTPSVRTTAVSGTLQVTDGTYTADVVGLYLGTSAGNTATAPNPTGPNAMYGFGGVDTFTGGTGADSIVGGGGADSLSGGAGNDTFYLANGDFASGESIDGGADADAIVLTNATTVNFTNGTVSNVETLTGSSGNDTVTMSANQLAGFNTINLGSGTNVLNVVAGGDISAATVPTISNVTTGNLTGTSGNDSITLTGAQLDAIIIGAGTINLGAGTDVINLTSTSADLNTLGATNASIQGVEAISAATAAAGVTLSLSGQTEGFTITGSANNDTITGGRGADTITGGAGVDRFVFGSGSSPGTVGGIGNAGTISGYDVITDFSMNAGGDVLDTPNVNVRANETVNGTDSVLTIGGQTIKSHQITNGIIAFSTNNTFSAATTVSLTSLANVAAAMDYVHRNDFATAAGANIGFVATINGTPHTFIFDQVGNNASAANDILVDLSGVTLTSLSGANLAPAGAAGEAINLGLTNPTDHLGLITVNITGVPAGWILSEGADNHDGTWSVQTSDVSALSITAPENYAGAVSLQISQTWTDSSGGTGLAMIANNVEAYAPGGPIFAIAGDDHLSGSSGNDLFVLAQPIGNDTIHSFDAAHDKVDLIAFGDLSSFADVQARLSQNSNGDAVITIAPGQSITFAGVSPKGLTADNFAFNVDPVMSNAKSIAIDDGAVLPLAGTVNNSGTIELASTGGEARLQVLANGLTLEGGGHVELSDGNGNIIAGTTPDATLTNVDNTISGAGQLGDGQLALHNQGTIIASGSNALTIDTGANEVVNAGTLEATGSGGLVIHSDVANSGLLWANGGNITTDGNVSGTGSALIDGTATFEMAGTFSGNVMLATDAAGTLKIDHAADFHGTVAGFDGNDALDLGDLAFGSSTTLGYAANSNDTGGTLTASDGTHTATIALLGQYAASSFAMSADGFGGTLIHDVPPTILAPTPTQLQHA